MVNTLKTMLVIALLVFPVFSKIDMPLENGAHQELNKIVIETAKTLQKLAPDLSESRRVKIAIAIHNNAEKYKISKKILMSIIKIESNFKSDTVSSTGDYSIVQINLKIWNKEFQRLGLAKIDKKKLIKSDDYAISRMCHILNIIKERYKKDRQWYARYHSNTLEFNKIYVLKINKVMKLIASR